MEAQLHSVTVTEGLVTLSPKVAMSQDFLVIFSHESNPNGPLINRLKRIWFAGTLRCIMKYKKLLTGNWCEGLSHLRANEWRHLAFSLYPYLLYAPTPLLELAHNTQLHCTVGSGNSGKPNKTQTFCSQSPRVRARAQFAIQLVFRVWR